MTAAGVASIMGTAVAPAARGALRSNGIVFVSRMSSANEQTSPNCAEECIITKQEHETTGTARRGAHHISGRGLVFQVAAEVQSLRHDLEFTSGGLELPHFRGWVTARRRLVERSLSFRTVQG
jgi:hypothetical protein